MALTLGELPERIECFDISHTAGGETVASCVVFGPSGAIKSDYRRFNIGAVTGGDDYAAIAQAVSRRYSRVQSGEGRLPDLILIDGGAGQVASARTVLESLALDQLPLVGVAKGRARRPGDEQLVLSGSRTSLRLGRDSPALLLIQRIRDEAHRFALTGHRQRRGRQRLVSELSEIPGLGPARRRALLRQFGGLAGVRGAGIADLAKVDGISVKLAERIYDRLHGRAPHSIE
jgi:excinuclease ABC subunit C